MNEKRCLGCMRVKQNSPICEHCGYDERRTNDPHQLQLGTLLQNQYYVGRVLGQGGFGITYMGWDNFLEIPVAIKEYYPNVVVTRNTTLSPAVYLRNSDGREQYMVNLRRFAKEARALAKLGAEEQLVNIVRVQNLVQANNTAYIIMEYVAGLDLREHMRRKGRPMTPGETLDMLLPLMQALDKVHAHGIIHRDISPDNIMVTRDGSAKLIDFGASHLAEMDNYGNQKSTEAIVKHGFAPMEQYSRRGKLGPWTDVYAMCATVYYCLTGKVLPPVMDRAFYHDEIDWSIVHGLSSGQLQAMKDGLTLGTDERIQTMAILYSRLSAPDEPVIPAPVMLTMAEFTLEPEISVLPMEAASETPEEIIPEATAPILAAEQPTELVAPEDYLTEVTVPILPEDLPTEVVVPKKMEEPVAEAEIYEAPEEESESEPLTEEAPAEEIPEETPEEAEETAPESEVPEEIKEELPELPEEEPEIPEPETPVEESEESDTAAVQESSVPAPKAEAPAKPARKKRSVWPKVLAVLFAVAAAALLVMKFVDFPESDTGSPEPVFWNPMSDERKENVLMNPYDGKEHTYGLVYRSDLTSAQILSVTFLDTLAEEPADSWDVSADKTGTVKAWAKPNGELYDLYIAADGGINGREACPRMFSGFHNLQEVSFGNAFRTDEATSMIGMFSGCSSLTKLDVSGFDTAQVTNMESMFSDCSRLTKLDVSGFNTANVTDMSSLFNNCRTLTALDVSNFDTSKTTDIGCMFSKCIALTELDISSFDTSNVLYMGALFSRCESLTELDLSHFDLSYSTTTAGMFYECNLKDVNHPELNKLLD